MQTGSTEARRYNNAFSPGERVQSLLFVGRLDDVTFEHRLQRYEFSHRAMQSGYFNLFHRMASKTMNIPKRNTTLATSEISDRSWYIVAAARVPAPRSKIQTRHNTSRGFGGEHF